MKHRGVIIVRVPYCAGVDIGKREDTPVKTIIKRGWAPKGVDYPMEKDEAIQAVDELIDEVMKCCECDEREAVKLLNAN